ncbi:MAG: hydrogenase maturation nickel metallochaperone HypA [Candidatus Nezhaarchaeota archaeon]|nr:hydrogenase maturation nickel metallochaperone HypA [Candidatus Nezhaarchaeota archaeon]
MHELSTASSIFEVVLEVASRHGAKKVLEVSIDVGELTLLNPDQLSMAFKALSEGSIAEGARLNINVVRAKARCKKCGEEWYVNLSGISPTINHLIFMTCPACDVRAFFKRECPKCGEVNFDFVSGNELVIKSIKIEK